MENTSIVYTLFLIFTGAAVLAMPVDEHTFTMSWEWFTHEFLSIWQPLILGSFILGTAAAILGVLFVRICWRLIVIRNWLKRYKNKNGG